MKAAGSTPKSAAIAGSLFILPFVVLNVIVAERVEPFFSLIRPGAHTSPFEYVLLLTVLLLLPTGAFIALRPLLRIGPDGERRFYPWNAATAALLVAVFALLSVILGSEMYRCEFLQIPNCD